MCKRWRSVALRAVRTLTWCALEASDAELDAARLCAALGLLPALASLRLFCDAWPLAAPLPATLTRLKVALRRTPPADSPLFSSHLPRLAALCLRLPADAPADAGAWTHACASLVARHAATLTALYLRSLPASCADPLVRALTEAGALHSLRTLALPALSLPVLQAALGGAPRLCELEVTCASAADVTRLPPAALSSLTRLNAHSVHLTDGVREFLEALPSLTRVCDLTGAMNGLLSVPPRLRPRFTLRRGAWQALASECPNARTVRVAGEWRGAVTAAPLPLLHTLDFDWSPHAAESALGALRAYAPLKAVRADLEGGQEEVDAAIAALTEACVRCGVRELRIRRPREQRSGPPAAVETAGWIRTFTPQHKLYR